MDGQNKKNVVHSYIPTPYSGNSPTTNMTITTSTSNMILFPSMSNSKGHGAGTSSKSTAKASSASNGNGTSKNSSPGTSSTSSGSCISSTGASSTSSLSAEKRKKILSFGQSQVYMPHKKSRPSTADSTPKGPKYPELADSLVLYNPVQELKYSPENPTGLVPVVVNPVLVTGTAAFPFPLDDNQKAGLKFMFKWFQNNKGCILAHYMGVGKTRTAITLILTLLEQAPGVHKRSTPAVKKCLILGPKNAIPAWKEEFQKWSPPDGFNPGIKVIQSYMKDASKILQDFCNEESSKILIMSYDSFKKFAPSIKYDGTKIDLVICDEAHLLKNNQTDRSVRLKDFQLFSKDTVWIGITGTPYQNSVLEYANLINFFRPDILNKNYKKEICAPIINCMKKNGRLSEKYHNMLLKFRKDVEHVFHYASNDLNITKHEVILCVPLANTNGGDETLGSYYNMQHTLYSELTQNMQPMKGLNFYQKLDLLKKVCIHPLYPLDNYANREEFEPYKKQLDEMKEFQETDFYFSSKIRVLLSMVGDLFNESPGEKVVVAAQSKHLLKKIATAFKQTQIDGDVPPELQFVCVDYDGDCSEKKRDDTLKEFDTHPRAKVLLLSCKAGGTALTLTSANHLFLMEPDWNPFVDRQTIGRVDRKGQERTVFVYRFLSTGTIEELKFLNQLSKEDFDKFFKERNGTNANENEAEQDKKLVFPIGDCDLIKYFPNTKSHINDLLEAINPYEDDEYDTEVRQFAEELSKASKYKDPNEVPDELPNLQRTWTRYQNYFSFVFHIKKAKDEVENVLLGDDEFFNDETIEESS